MYMYNMQRCPRRGFSLEATVRAQGFKAAWWRGNDLCTIARMEGPIVMARQGALNNTGHVAHAYVVPVPCSSAEHRSLMTQPGHGKLAMSFRRQK